MSIKIEINTKQLNASNDEPLQLHYLPAKINGDGEANVERYFNNYTRPEEHAGGHLTNALRGYPLLGEEMTVLAGYRALVLQETQRPLVEETERTLRLTGSFERFHYWNYDKVPSKADSYRQSLQTLAIASELAKPISEADVEKELAMRKEHLVAKENQ